MKLSTVAALLAFASFSPAVAQTVLRSVSGAPGDQLGRSVDFAGDYNNDGFQDLIVGCPGDSALVQDAGSVSIISGKYLALGTGNFKLSTRYGVNGEPSFGWSVCNVGDVTGDGRNDFLVGQPSYDPFSSSQFQYYADEGQVHLLSGLGLNWIDTYSGSVTAANETMQFGWSLAYLGDWDQDGVREVAVGAPFYDGSGSTDRGRVYILKVTATGLVFSSVITGLDDTEQFGYSLSAANFGVYGGVGGVRELVVGSPGYDLFSTDQGRVQIWGKVPSSTTPQLITSYSGDYQSHFGHSVDASGDINGDGYSELAVGAPYADANGTDSGRVYVFNGSSLLPNSWFHSFTFDGASSSDLFGASVRIVSDVNGDGVRDVMIGAPSTDAILSGDNYGRVYAYSGDTSTLLESQGGFLHQGLGRVIGPSLDLDGDGIAEWIACGPDSDNGGANVGVIYAISTFPATPTTYCTGKTNSLGCVPAMSSSGAPSASSGSPFTITTANLLNQKSSLQFYGFRALGIPFQGGTLCVTSPSVRMQIVSSGGNAAPANDCTGSIAYDYNARIQSGIDPNLSVGQEVFVQAWARDPASASTTSLSNAIRFVIAP